MGRAAKLGQMLRSVGTKTTCLYILSRLCTRARLPAAVYSYRIVAQPIRAAPRLKGSRGKAFTAREVGPGDPALLDMPLDRDLIAYRFGQGAVCLGLFNGAEWVGCIWLCLGAYDEDEVYCRFVSSPAGRASWDFDVYVKPSYRSGLAFLRLWDEADAYLRARGIAYSCSRISAFNIHSRHSHARLGAKDLGGADFFVLGRVQVMLSSLHPRVHIGSKSGPRPTVRIALDAEEEQHKEAPEPSY